MVLNELNKKLFCLNPFKLRGFEWKNKKVYYFRKK